MHGNMILAALPIFTGAYGAILDRRRPARAVAARQRAGPGRRGGAGGDPDGRRRRTPATLGGDALVAASALVVAVGYVAGRATRPGRLPGAGRDLLGRHHRRGAGGAACWRATIAVDGLPDAGAHAWGAVLCDGGADVDRRLRRLVLGARAGGIQRIATIQFLQPISGLLLAAWLLGEQFTVPLVVASIAILGGRHDHAAALGRRVARAMERFRLDGKVALVTGAGSPTGIGFAAGRTWPSSARSSPSPRPRSDRDSGSASWPPRASRSTPASPT